MSQQEWTGIIGASVVPVVIISACGLLSLAFYGRLATVVARLRGFQREMWKEQETARRKGEPEQVQYLGMLQTQTRGVTHRARLIRLALFFLLMAVAQLIVCSLALGLSLMAPGLAPVAAVFFVFGLLSMLAGVITASIELGGALHPVELEARFVSKVVGAIVGDRDAHDGPTDPAHSPAGRSKPLERNESVSQRP